MNHVLWVFKRVYINPIIVVLHLGSVTSQTNITYRVLLCVRVGVSEQFLFDNNSRHSTLGLGAQYTVQVLAMIGHLQDWLRT